MESRFAETRCMWWYWEFFGAVRKVALGIFGVRKVLWELTRLLRHWFRPGF